MGTLAEVLRSGYPRYYLHCHPMGAEEKPFLAPSSEDEGVPSLEPDHEGVGLGVVEEKPVDFFLLAAFSFRLAHLHPFPPD